MLLRDSKNWRKSSIILDMIQKERLWQNIEKDNLRQRVLIVQKESNKVVSGSFPIQGDNYPPSWGEAGS